MNTTIILQTIYVKLIQHSGMKNTKNQFKSYDAEFEKEKKKEGYHRVIARRSYILITNLVSCFNHSDKHVQTVANL